MIGVQSISMLEGAFERTRAYTKDRMVFGKPLIQLQVSIIFNLKMLRRAFINLIILNYLFRQFNTVWLKSKPKPLLVEHSVTLP